MSVLSRSLAFSIKISSKQASPESNTNVYTKIYWHLDSSHKKAFEKILQKFEKDECKTVRDSSSYPFSEKNFLRAHPQE